MFEEKLFREMTIIYFIVIPILALIYTLDFILLMQYFITPS